MIEGKQDAAGASLLPSHGHLSANQIAIAIAERLLAHGEDARCASGCRGRGRPSARAAGFTPAMLRLPYFCPGCPHSSSTHVPEGSKALAGIGCHFMVQWMDRDTSRFTQMGGEGASWLGEAPFSTRPHMFQNVGDGTFYHSGSLAVRAAVASGANLTFKILYNDAVAMTGGQKMETGNLDVPAITRAARIRGRAGDRRRHRRAGQISARQRLRARRACLAPRRARRRPAPAARGAGRLGPGL